MIRVAKLIQKLPGVVRLTNRLKKAAKALQKSIQAIRLRSIKKLLKRNRIDIIASAFIVRKQRPRAVEKLMSHIQRNNPSYKGLKADEATARHIVGDVLDNYNDIQIGRKNNRIYLFKGDQGISLRLDNLEFDTFLDKKLPLK